MDEWKASQVAARLQDVLNEDPRHRIVLLGDPELTAAQRLQDESSQYLDPSLAPLLQGRAGEDRVASVIQVTPDHFASMATMFGFHNLWEFVIDFPLLTSIAFRPAETPLADLWFSLFARNTYGSVWDGMIIRIKKDGGNEPTRLETPRPRLDEPVPAPASSREPIEVGVGRNLLALGAWVSVRLARRTLLGWTAKLVGKGDAGTHIVHRQVGIELGADGLGTLTSRQQLQHHRDGNAGVLDPRFPVEHIRRDRNMFQQRRHDHLPPKQYHSGPTLSTPWWLPAVTATLSLLGLGARATHPWALLWPLAAAGLAATAWLLWLRLWTRRAMAWPKPNLQSVEAVLRMNRRLASHI